MPTTRECAGCASEAQPTDPGSAYLNGMMTAFLVMAIDRRAAAGMIGSLCSRHRPIVPLALTFFAKANGVTMSALTSALNTLLGMHS